MLPEWLLSTPYSTLFTFALASAISLSTNLLNKKFVNREQVALWQGEISKWNAEKNLAKRTGDKRLLAKVKKREPRILQLQSKMFSQQMKTSLVTFIPLIIMWQILIGFFQSTPVVRLPDGMGIGIWFGIGTGQFFDLPFFFWYLICSFFIQTLLSRILGVGMRMGLGTGASETK